MRSMQIRSAVTSPCLAFWIILLIRPSASPSRSCSASTVAALRAPGGRPRGLPLWPFGKGRPRCFGAILPIDIPILSRETTRPRISQSYLDVLPQNADSWNRRHIPVVSSAKATRKMGRGCRYVRVSLCSASGDDHRLGSLNWRLFRDEKLCFLNSLVRILRTIVA